MMYICGSGGGGEVGAKDEQTNKRVHKDSCMVKSTVFYLITCNLPIVTFKKTDKTWVLRKRTAGQESRLSL